MTTTTIAPACAPDPNQRPNGDMLTIAYSEYDALMRACLAALAADARGLANPLSYIHDALDGITPHPGAHPHEYVPVNDGDATWGRW